MKILRLDMPALLVYKRPNLQYKQDLATWEKSLLERATFVKERVLLEQEMAVWTINIDNSPQKKVQGQSFEDTTQLEKCFCLSKKINQQLKSLVQQWGQELPKSSQWLLLLDTVGIIYFFFSGIIY